MTYNFRNDRTILAALHLNKKALLDSMEQDEETVEQMLALANEQLTDLLERLKIAFKDKDLKRLKDVNHKLRGGAMACCFDRLVLQTKILTSVTSFNEAFIRQWLEHLEQEINYLISNEL